MNTKPTKLELLSIYSFSIVHAISYLVILGITSYSCFQNNEIATYTDIIKATIGLVIFGGLLTAIFLCVIADDINSALFRTYENLKTNKIKRAFSAVWVIIILSLFGLLANELSHKTHPEIPYFSVFLIALSVNGCIVMTRRFLESISDQEVEKTDMEIKRNNKIKRDT